MRHFHRLWAVYLCFSSLVLAGLDRAAAETPEARVKAAFHSLNEWLADDANAPGWHAFLKSDELSKQLEKGPAADRKQVQAILAAYASDTPGLDKSAFTAVRQALVAWLPELPPLQITDLPQAARDAKQSFVPIGKDDVQRAKLAAVTASQKLLEFLAGSGEHNTEKWKAYLHWNELQQQLNSEAAPDLQALQTIVGYYTANVSGLEVSYFVAVREALERYLNVLVFTTTPDAKQYLDKQLDELARLLEAYAKHPSVEDGIAIGKIVGWLEKFGQAQDLVSAVRRHYWHSNLFVQISENMLRTAIETEMEETLTVEEVILGTTITGEAQMKGRLSLDLVPNENGAAIDILLLGTTTSKNVGYNGPVTIFSEGVTSVDARKRVTIDPLGVTSCGARAVCETNSTINNIAANSNLIRNAAWNRAGKMKPQAERIASERAARRVEAKMDEESADLLERGDYLFQEKFRAPLVRRGGFPKSLQISTTHDHLHFNLLQSAGDQLAAMGAPPALTADHDLAVRVHESLVANMSQAFLGGLTLTDERLQEIVENLAGEVPEELAANGEEEPWSITFADERPIDVRFEGQGFSVQIRGTRFTRGDQEVKRSLVIGAKYRIEKGLHGVKLTRQGEVEVDFAKGNAKQSVQQVAMRTFMKKKFEKIFKAEVVSEGIALPGPSRSQEAGKMRLQQLQCDQGWLVLGWLQPSRNDRTARKP